MSGTPETGLTRGAYVLVLGLPLVRGLWRLGVPDVWFDEAATWNGVTGSWRHLFEHALAGDDCGGILYAAMLKLWVGVAGTSEVALRLPSVVVTVALAGVVAAVGRRLWGDRAGLYAGLMVGLYPVVFLKSREARCYALETFLYALALLGLVLLLQRRRRAGGWLLAASGSLLVVTHVFGAFAFAGIAAVAALAPLTRAAAGTSGAREHVVRVRRAAANLVPAVPVLAVLGAWLVVFWTRIGIYREEFWIRVPMAAIYLGLVEYLLPLALAVAILWRARGRPGERELAAAGVALALPILLGPLAASLTTPGDHHFVLERYFLPVAVLGALALGYLLSRLPARAAAGVAALILLAAVLKPGLRVAYTDAQSFGMLSEEAAAFLRPKVEAGEPVFIAPDLQLRVLEYYGVRGRSAGGWTCGSLPPSLSGPAAGPTPRTVWVAHLRCGPEELAPGSVRVVSRRRFGSLSVEELAVGTGARPAPGGRPGGSGTPGSPKAGRTTPDAPGSGSASAPRPSESPGAAPGS